MRKELEYHSLPDIPMSDEENKAGGHQLLQRLAIIWRARDKEK